MAFNFPRSAKNVPAKNPQKYFFCKHLLYSGGKVPSNKNQTMKCYCSSIAQWIAKIST